MQAKVNQILSAQKKTPTKSVDAVAREVIAGKWGSGDARKKKLTAAGYDYNAVQRKVNEFMSKKTLKPVDAIAKEVIQGKWGSGAERKRRLLAAGYDYDAIQKRVNQMMK